MWFWFAAYVACPPLERPLTPPKVYQSIKDTYSQALTLFFFTPHDLTTHFLGDENERETRYSKKNVKRVWVVRPSRENSLILHWDLMLF